jgi:hypothetical protein
LNASQIKVKSPDYQVSGKSNREEEEMAEISRNISVISVYKIEKLENR